MDALFGQGQLDGDPQGSGSSSSGGILPSNDSYRPTQGAIRHSEDTEFNDALRARGIIPPKQSTSQRTPTPERSTREQTLSSKIESSNLSDDEDLLALEDEDIPSSILEKYRNERLNQVKELNRTRKFGTVLPIGRESYTREINEASEVDIDEENNDLKGKGTGVVCFLWKDGIPESILMSQHLNKLATAYPSTKFVSIRGDMCIANYPDKNIPTLLIYRRGQLIKQIVGMSGSEFGFRGMKTSITDVEALLVMCDAIDPLLKVAPTVEEGRRQDDEDDDSDSDGGYGRRNGMRRGGIRRTLGSNGNGNTNYNDSDDELDL